MIRESESSVPINENGRRKRASKHEVAIKQLMKLAMNGSIQALRLYLGVHRQAHERGRSGGRTPTQQLREVRRR
jgi:hypothetical protein